MDELKVIPPIVVEGPSITAALFPFASSPDQTSHSHPISSMVTKICHHAAVVYVRAARW